MMNFASKTFVVFFALTALLLNGCGEKEEHTVDQVKIVRGNEQCALPEEYFSHTLQVELLGPVEPGLLGGEGSRSPIAGATVHFVPLDNSQIVITPATARTDAGGLVSVNLKAGRQTGDQYVKIIPEGFENKSITARFITGMKIEGQNQEAAAGGFTDRPIEIKLVDKDGQPAAGVPVYFRWLSTVEGKKTTASIKTPIAVSDSRGIAETQIKLGGKTGEYNLGIEVADPDSDIFIRNKNIKLMGLDLTGVIIAVLGGLALFIYGMTMMGDGIQKIAGENMKKVLQFFAKNGIVAVLAGTLVTAIIQSSSATTVMVIGFINAGLLSLTQSIGIIFGANIGTTVTAQIISFNLTGLAIPAIIIGFLLMMMFKSQIVKGWGETTLGFGLLFFGMNMMSVELKELGDLPSFVNVFRTFDCTPVTHGGFMPFGSVMGALAIGMLATFVIQSSSAAMGIILALAGSGLINFYTSIPLLLGTNIGTTITAMLAAIPANRVAKQAAIAHSMFNIFGSLVMIVLFYFPYGPDRIPVFLYFINEITPGNVFAAEPQNVERHIAMAHTFFNIIVALLLLPFIKQFAELCNWILPIRQKEKVIYQTLEPHLLNTPSIALEQTASALKVMVNDGWRMIDTAVNEVFMAGKVDGKKVESLVEQEVEIDNMQAAITDYLVQITRRQLTEPQSNLVPLLMHCTNDAERIADHADNIIKLAARLKATKCKISDEGRKDLDKMWRVLNDQAAHVIAALSTPGDLESVKDALKDERKINKLADKFEGSHLERLSKGKCQLANSIIFIEMLGELEKIGDHLSNIAERTPEIQKHYIKL